MPLEYSGVRELVAAFGTLPTEVRLALKPAVLEAADLVGDAAKSNAGWSSWIPDHISVSASFSASGGGAVIRAAERGYPHGGEVRVFEGNGLSPTPFLHPVYGHRNNWVSAMTHPFLQPALDENADEATAIIAAAVTSVVASHL
jgi:ABC-type transport system substrate-binding protein